MVVLHDRFRVSQRRACRLTGQHRNTQRRPVPPADIEEQKLKRRILELARRHVRWGRPPLPGKLPTNLYGPGDNYHPTNSHVLPALIRRFHEAAERGDASVTCWGSGTPMREFLHVDDLGEACVFALEHWQPGPEEQQFLNVGTGLDLTIRELAEAVAEATGFQGEIRWDTSKPDGTPKKQLDVGRLAALGWRARIPLVEGLASTVKEFCLRLRQQEVRL